MNEILLEKEFTFLKEEMRELKNCQVQFVTFSVTGTGVLFGLVALTRNELLGVSYLFPLTILLPSWLIFFDKARTITRIVGYYRIVEKLSLGQIDAEFIGWENALAEFRRFEQEGKLKSSPEKDTLISRIIKLVLLQASPYWTQIYFIFLGLSALSCFLSFRTKGDMTIVIMAFILVGIFAIYNLKVLWELIWGLYSHKSNYENWKTILNAKPIR